MATTEATRPAHWVQPAESTQPLASSIQPQHRIRALSRAFVAQNRLRQENGGRA
jgi:hypothetical protein